ncbi:MAG: type IV toxin-antitoxin system AbiEi family antitoxin domain-containing protein [Aridibacter sp.]|jgi:predicted transcriptional regulator of viral defense system
MKTTNNSNKNKKKILDFARQKKFIKPSDLSEIVGIGIYISRLVEKGELVKIGRGLYSLPEQEISEWETFLETARLVPNGIFCLLSALRFHDLTTQNPFQIWIALEGTASRAYSKSKKGI